MIQDEAKQLKERADILHDQVVEQEDFAFGSGGGTTSLRLKTLPLPFI
jgi:hypothetical protein